METKMDLGFPNWSLFLCIIVLLECGYGNGLREINNKHTQMSSQDHHQGHQHMHTLSSPSLFFSINDLLPGKTILMQFPNSFNFSSAPKFLPREQADSIPFSSQQLPNLLRFFSISPDSLQAKLMKDSLRLCEIEPVKEETKLCATSLESVLDFVGGVFGSENGFRALTTPFFKSSNNLFRNYRVLGKPDFILTEKMVACHAMAYPYAVFYCHSTASGKPFKNSLAAAAEDDSDQFEAFGVCHMDTSYWSPNHVAFKRPGAKPGIPLCHFFVADNLIWVAARKFSTAHDNILQLLAA